MAMRRQSGPAPTGRRANGALRLLERGLLAVGLVCLIVYGSACTQRALFQRWHKRSFERDIAQAIQWEQHDQSSWSSTRIERFEASLEEGTDSLGRLDVPAAGISVMVLDGTDDWTLDRAVGRIEGTAMPGEPGNFGIAGHRDGIFRGLEQVALDDELSFFTHDGISRYVITALGVVEPEDVEVLDPTDESTITLVTCYPFYYVGDAPQRYIVHARQVAFD